MRHSRVIAALAALVLLAVAAPAAADITGFLGATTTPSTRGVRGLAVGGGFLVVGFEFEYASTSEDVTELAPSLRTGMFNVLVQTPVPVAGLQFYATLGGGLFRERLAEHSETHVGANIGGGAKLHLAGPLRLRLDYRVFTLRGSPLHQRYHRLYAGVNLGF